MTAVKHVFNNVEEAYELRLQANEYIAAAEATALALLTAGEPAKGYRLKAGNKVRKFRSPDDFEKAMVAGNLLTLDELYDFKLKGIPAIEKLFKEKNIDAAILLPYLEVNQNAPSLQNVGV